MFWLLGYNISYFRTLGAIVLVVAGGWLGWSSMVVVSRFRVRRVGREFWICFMGATIGSVGSLIYYSSLLSTPSYNWLNLVGIIVASAGYLNLCANDLHPIGLNTRYLWFFSAVTAAGLFISMPAKPSSSLLLYVSGGVLLFLHSPLNKAIIMNLKIILCLLILIAISILSGFWQRSAAEIILLYFQKPTLVPGQTPQGAIRGILSLPITYFNQLIHLETGVLTCLVIGVSMIVFGALSALYRWRLASISAFGGLCLVAASGLFVAQATLGIGTKSVPIHRSCFASLVTGILSVFIASAIPPILSLFRMLQTEDCRLKIIHVVKLISFASFLMASSFVYGFGSSNTPYRMASESVVFLLLGAAVLDLFWRSWFIRASSIFILVVVTGLLVVSTLIDARTLPYRQKAIAEQTVPLRVGRHGAVLRVSHDIADQLMSLRQQAESAGWKPGTPLIGVVWSWASTVPYFLGAKVPDSLMLTIFGYPNSVELARFRIARQLSNFPVKEAWIMTNESALLEDCQLSEVKEVLSALSEATKFAFPQNYKRVALSGGLELWKPADP